MSFRNQNNGFSDPGIPRLEACHEEEPGKSQEEVEEAKEPGILCISAHLFEKSMKNVLFIKNHLMISGVCCSIVVIKVIIDN